jgi:hypothetical protein
MKKCGRCIFGSWVVGLSAVAWGVAGALGLDLGFHGWLRPASVVVALIGASFVAYQAPFAPCPACLARQGLSAGGGR